MDIQLQKYYEDRLSMMGGTAWKELVEDVQEMYNSTNNIVNIPNENMLHFRKGELSIMNWILGLRDLTDKAYEELKREDIA